MLIDALARAPDLVIPMVREAAPEIVKRRPAEGRWSIHEHACHLAEVQPMITERLELMLSLDDPEIQAYDPGREHPPDGLLEVELEGALERFRVERNELVERLRMLDPSDWSRTARHAEYNAYSPFIIFRHLALHDFFHAYRIEEMLLYQGWPERD